jgi:predicted enzyme related to lactoylglutathione lyase
MNQNMNWFMIPVKIFERAIDFYSVLFDQKISKDEDHK